MMLSMEIFICVTILPISLTDVNIIVDTRLQQLWPGKVCTPIRQSGLEISNSCCQSLTSILHSLLHKKRKVIPKNNKFFNMKTLSILSPQIHEKKWGLNSQSKLCLSRRRPPGGQSWHWRWWKWASPSLSPREHPGHMQQSGSPIRAQQNGDQ